MLRGPVLTDRSLVPPARNAVPATPSHCANKRGSLSEGHGASVWDAFPVPPTSRVPVKLCVLPNYVEIDPATLSWTAVGLNVFQSLIPWSRTLCMN